MICQRFACDGHAFAHVVPSFYKPLRNIKGFAKLCLRLPNHSASIGKQFAHVYSHFNWVHKANIANRPSVCQCFAKRLHTTDPRFTKLSLPGLPALAVLLFGQDLQIVCQGIANTLLVTTNHLPAVCQHISLWRPTICQRFACDGHSFANSLFAKRIACDGQAFANGLFACGCQGFANGWLVTAQAVAKRVAC
jgi:hypothetical protein